MTVSVTCQAMYLTPLKLSAFFADYINSCEKGKPLERVGRKASGLVKQVAGLPNGNICAIDTSPFFHRKDGLFY